MKAGDEVPAVQTDTKTIALAALILAGIETLAKKRGIPIDDLMVALKYLGEIVEMPAKNVTYFTLPIRILCEDCVVSECPYPTARAAGKVQECPKHKSVPSDDELQRREGK